MGKDEIEVDFKKIILVFASVIFILMVGIVLRGFFQQPPAIGVDQIRVAIIRADSCPDCFDAERVLSDIQGIGFNITVKEYFDISTSQGKALAQKYGVQRVPAVLVFGNFQSLTRYWDAFGVQRDDALVMTKQRPVYIELSSGDAVGRVKSTLMLAKDCPRCSNLSQLMTELEGAGVVFVNKSTIFDEPSLMRRYNISILPTLILSADAQAYDFIISSWTDAGTIESDGSLVLRYTDLPYYDVSSRSIRGLVNVTLLTDNSCKDCYDPIVHVDILENVQGMDMKIDSTRKVDISTAEGQALLSKYSITKVPTVVVFGDASLYPVFLQIWPQVGSSESDGSYVFRAVENMDGATYKDLSDDSVKKGIPK